MQLDAFKKFIGMMIKDCGDDIQALAKKHGFTEVTYAFPDGIDNIDVEPRRLKVFLGKDDRVKKFGKG